MGVNKIYIEDGVKYCHPITTRDQYLAFRNSGDQRMNLDKARNGDTNAKMKLIQMNYSSISPTQELTEGKYPDFPLRGCATICKSVGMDIDLSKETVQDQQKFQEIRDKILSKKDELGLLMLERSATKGYHLVFRRHPELTQEENLHWASNLIGVPFDNGAKDVTRVFFSTTGDKEELLYLSDELFEREKVELLKPSPSEKKFGEHIMAAQPASVSAVVTTNSLPEGEGQGEAPHSSTLIAFDLCVKEAGLSPDAMDIWGERNWHTNLMAVLSVGLPKLMSKEQLYAVVNEKLPNYSQTDDCRKLIEYFYENYSADKGFMSSTLREINAKAQQAEEEAAEAASSNTDTYKESRSETELEESLSTNWAPPAIPKKIPRLMNLLTDNYDPRFRSMLLLSALPVLSAHASHFRAKYLNGKEIGPNQFVAVIGGSGSGKGNCTDLYNEMVEHTLNENDKLEWAKVKENAELRDKMANAKDRPAKYHPKLRLFETTSKSSLLEMQTNLGEHGMLLGQFSEADGLMSSLKAAFSNISVMLRKGWDQDMMRQFYMSDSSCNTYTRMSISLLVSGTVKAVLERMLGDENCEGGLMQRFIPVIVPKGKRTFRPPMQNCLNEADKQERDSLLIDLYQKDLALGDDVKVLETPMVNRAIGKWFDELEQRYNDGQLTDAEADLSHRCGEFMLRAAIPLVALYGQETKEIVDFCRWVGETAHYYMCRLFGLRVQKDIASSNEMLNAHTDARKTAEPMLDKMPTVFTFKQFQEQRVKDGQSDDVAMLLSRYCKAGKLKREKKGVYRKCTDPAQSA